jgi:3alpha(or 20beta)-hydroxysteroid dehydrogenase
MIAAGGGSIINISSVEGLRGSPWVHGYVASKFGVRGLTKSAALELAPHGIRVNSVHPGLIRTPMTAGIPEDFLTIPLGRAADPGEVSTFVLFLASDESSYATGSEFVVDGGLVAGVPHKAV